MEEEPARRRAALAGGADGGEEHGAQREIEVGVVGDDDAVVAAELEERAAEPLGDDLADRLAHADRAGRRDQREAPVGRRAAAPTAWRSPTARFQIGGASLAASTRCAILVTAIAAERRLLGRLPERRVAADRGDHRVPGPDRDGEVEGGDDADRPERMPLLVHPVERPLGVHRQAVELARQADAEVGHVDHLLHLAQALGADLADLERDQLAEVVLVLAQRLAELAHDLAARRRRPALPVVEGRRRSTRRRARSRRSRLSRTAAIASPVAGLIDSTRWPGGLEPAPAKAPEFSSARPRRERREETSDGLATVMGISA